MYVVGAMIAQLEKGKAKLEAELTLQVTCLNNSEWKLHDRKGFELKL